MELEEIIKLPIGTAFYMIKNEKMTKVFLLAHSPNRIFSRYIFLIDESKNLISIDKYSTPHKYEQFRLNYEEAKEVMWEQMKDRIATINKIYFENSKQINIE